MRNLNIYLNQFTISPSEQEGGGTGNNGRKNRRRRGHGFGAVLGRTGCRRLVSHGVDGSRPVDHDGRELHPVRLALRHQQTAEFDRTQADFGLQEQ